ncbi:MliC family protein [Cyanobium sp. FGCU-6]|jgi:hypothetical protein|nr:MliC family protein [Cyanobium sp. FGCU6]
MTPFLAGLGLLPFLAMGSPWWEDYEQRDSYRCDDRGTVVVERNDSQASLIAGRYRSTLFREASDAPGLRYRNEEMRLIVRGDELTVERLPMRFTCTRTDQG